MHTSLIIAAIVLPMFVSAHTGTITLLPQTLMQGEPLLATISGAHIDDIARVTLNGKKLPVFVYNGKPTVLAGVDLYDRPGNYRLAAEIIDGAVFEKKFLVSPRKKVSAPLGIPEKLGGNTKKSQTALVTNLQKENALIAKAVATSTPLWDMPFVMPLSSTTVTDAYGYSRKTGSYSIPHKGTDFRAAVGTLVFAVNDGTVILARDFTVYGKTVAIDHGTGVASLYMHLSKLSVTEGDKVKRGQRIGLSGESGYATSPHLHLSIKIRGVSIDPMKFFALFK